jgi:hypothetical protein
MAMTNPETYVAFALSSGVVHLCVDSRDIKGMPATSLCREVNLTTPRARVEVDDLGNLQTFNLCKGCVARYELLGYRKLYAPELPQKKVNPAQIALF